MDYPHLLPISMIVWAYKNHGQCKTPSAPGDAALRGASVVRPQQRQKAGDFYQTLAEKNLVFLKGSYKPCFSRRREAEYKALDTHRRASTYTKPLGVHFTTLDAYGAASENSGTALDAFGTLSDNYNLTSDDLDEHLSACGYLKDTYLITVAPYSFWDTLKIFPNEPTDTVKGPLDAYDTITSPRQNKQLHPHAHSGPQKDHISSNPITGKSNRIGSRSRPWGKKHGVERYLVPKIVTAMGKRASEWYQRWVVNPWWTSFLILLNRASANQTSVSSLPQAGHSTNQTSLPLLNRDTK